MNDRISPLLTDLYQLTMAQGYWKSGRAGQTAVFHLFFRTLPFGGGYAVAAGLADAVRYLRDFRFAPEEFDYLAALTAPDGSRLFEPDFLAYLRTVGPACEVDAIPEGTVVFPHEPLVRVQGPILLGQLFETALLNILNFQTLIATKAARICGAARGEPVLEFGLRRAQGRDGALSASRAAFIGGCSATSNVLAGQRYGIPVRGTHAHSWVMSFDTEAEAFAAYAQAMPNNCVFLVDTYDTLDGVREAIAVGRQLRAQGRELLGVRLDSGDLAWLSQEARRLLDEAGFPQAAIVASNDLDEHVIESLKHQHAAIGVWGVGTRLVTAYDQPALGGVYKLTAVQRPDGGWQPRIKLSEQAVKISNPGRLRVRRYVGPQGFLGDAIYDEDYGVAEPATVVDPVDPTRHKRLPADATCEELLVPVLRDGRVVCDQPDLPAIQQRARAQLAGLHEGIRRLENPHRYPAGLEASLYRRKLALIEAARAAREVPCE